MTIGPILKPIVPFEPISTQAPPEGDVWTAQIKWDGVRMLTYYNGQHIKLINRNLNDRTAQYPEFADPAVLCTARSFILDGEIIAFDRNKPAFHEIMRRDQMRNTDRIAKAVHHIPATYMIFDVLYANDTWVTNLPLTERQELLDRIIKPQSNVHIVQNFADGAALFETMRQHDMEGVVFKRLDSLYVIGGKDKRWQKLKAYKDLYAAIGGVTMKHGIVSALLLGLFDEAGRLHYIGHAGTGKLTHADWQDLTKTIRPLKAAQSPFSNFPVRSKEDTMNHSLTSDSTVSNFRSTWRSKNNSAETFWVTPSLAAKVQFMEWTPDGVMRQPSIQSIIKTDVDPNQCSISQLNS